MATVLTVMNMKGGVGKTTAASHLAGMAANYDLGKGKPLKVLLIDYDPQFNSSQAYVEAKKYFSLEKEGKTVLSVLVEDTTKLDPFKLYVPGNHTPPKVKDIVTSISDGKHGGKLDLVLSSLDLMFVALGQPNKTIDPIQDRFSKFIAEARGIYDLIVIDCHPAGSIFTQTSLMNSDHVLIPVVPHKFALRGVGLMTRFMKSKQIGAQGPVPHILFNNVPRVNILPQEREIRRDKDVGGFCLRNTLKYYKAFADPEAGRNFVWNSSKPWSGAAFRNLETVCREIIGRII
jgi:chromosome partitioning protein